MASENYGCYLARHDRFLLFGGGAGSARIARRLMADGLGVELMGGRSDFQLFLVGDGGQRVTRAGPSP